MTPHPKPTYKLIVKGDKVLVETPKGLMHPDYAYLYGWISYETWLKLTPRVEPKK